MSIPMQFQMIENGAARGDHRLVLNSVKLSELFWKDLLNMTSKQFLFVAATATLYKRLINGDVATAGVLDKKCSVGNVVEELFDNTQFRGRARRHFRERTGKC